MYSESQKLDCRENDPISSGIGLELKPLENELTTSGIDSTMLSKLPNLGGLRRANRMTYSAILDVLAPLKKKRFTYRAYQYLYLILNLRAGISINYSFSDFSTNCG